MKRFLIPSQKGTELYPQVTQQPTKLIVRGVQPDTPEWRMVAERYGGRLQSFHAKAQQEYALSINPSSKIRYKFDDGATAIYTNLQGQEILELIVDNKVVAGFGKLAKDHWDWALIKIETPNTNHPEAVRGAVIKAYRKVPGPGEPELKFGGFAFDIGEVWPDDGLTYYSDGMDPFSISFAPHDEPVETVTVDVGSTQITTLLVDLRRFPGMTCVIDLYGFLAMGESDEFQIVGYSRNPGPDRTSVSTVNIGPVLYPSGWPYDPNGNWGTYDNLGFRVAYDDFFAPLTALRADQPLLFTSQVHIPAPRLALPGGTSPTVPPATVWNDNDTYHFSGLLTGLTQHFYFQLTDPVTHFASADSYIITQVYEWDIETLLADFLIHPGPETRSAPISGVGGFGWLDWGEVFYNGPTWQFAEWVVKPLLPARLQLMGMGKCEIASSFPSPDDGTYEYRFLGSVTIDPVLKSISFGRAR